LKLPPYSTLSFWEGALSFEVLFEVSQLQKKIRAVVLNVKSNLKGLIEEQVELVKNHKQRDSSKAVVLNVC
jgi:hypothetical protein